MKNPTLVDKKWLQEYEVHKFTTEATMDRSEEIVQSIGRINQKLRQERINPDPDQQLLVHLVRLRGAMVRTIQLLEEQEVR